MTPKCPKCGSVIYSRRNFLCGICGERLPDELLFSPQEREKVERDLHVLKQLEIEMRRRVAEHAHDVDPDIGGV
jgi:tRNA(Ile2) C34 agmatinyltransferase TiaS